VTVLSCYALLSYEGMNTSLDELWNWAACRPCSCYHQEKATSKKDQLRGLLMQHKSTAADCLLPELSEVATAAVSRTESKILPSTDMP
jgi:hypothetical protein